MTKQEQTLTEVTILFAGDSGDGIQLTGNEFANVAALFGNDLSTFPNYPAEIRAPQGTLLGVSGFQVRFGSTDVFTPGDKCDVLVVMNAAAFKTNINNLKKGGIIIANTAGFDAKNLKLAKYEDNDNPLEHVDIQNNYTVYSLPVNKIVQEALKEFELSSKEIDRTKNMFILGFLLWLYQRPLDFTIDSINKKFENKPIIAQANVKVLEIGYHYADTVEIFATRYKVEKAQLQPGKYRNIMGNHATALGLVAAAHQANLPLFYGSYPITPASDILHELSKYKQLGVKTFQAEDEIAAICAAIGAAYGGALGTTGSSGPGIALKTEAMGLAVMLEIPLVIVNVQRGGPSTGLPTKTEQADLMQAVYGRNGEAPIPVLAAQSPADCFATTFEAAKIAIEHMTPVIVLTDGYIANGAEPWKYPNTENLPKIKPNFAQPNTQNFLPYKRNENLVRPWAIPGMEGLAHRIGGIEKQNETGNISYDPENHQLMVKLRAEKIKKIADNLPLQVINTGSEQGDLLVISWGSTYGAVKEGINLCLNKNLKVSHVHLRHINPLPKNLGSIIQNFKKILVPEMNNGQLIHIIRSHFLVDAIPLNKIKGLPFSPSEIEEKITSILSA